MRLLRCVRRWLPGLALMLVGTTAWPASPATEILGRPADRSITVNVRPETALEVYYEYGTAPALADWQTASRRVEAGEAAEFLMDGLEPDSRYFYRMRWRPAESDGDFETGTEHTFQTQRSRSSGFVFCLQGDSHPERERNMFDGELYRRTLTAVAAEQPDFYLLMGDDFSVDTLKEANAESVSGRYTLQLPYLGLLAHSTPLFLVNGNHEQAARYLLDGTPDNVAVLAQNARNRYYPQPTPDDFYSGNPEEVPHIGLLRNYYSWHWGDALFVVLDPYWASPVPVDNVFGNKSQGAGSNGKTADKWLITHGDAQYQWLKQTLESSPARWKFVFAHHVLGTGRGGVADAGGWEWGGFDDKGRYQFPARRPEWPQPIHQLLASNGVTVFFQGHDHLFAREQLDGVVYQELPCPADFTYTAFNADAYAGGDVFPNSGYVRVTVAESEVTVDYIRTFLPADENAERTSGMLQYSYRITAPAPAAPQP